MDKQQITYYKKYSVVIVIASLVSILINFFQQQTADPFLLFILVVSLVMMNHNPNK